MTELVVCPCIWAGSPVSAQPVIMAAPPLPTVLSSGPGKALALVPGGGGQVQPMHVLQNPPQPTVTMVRVVTSNPLTSNPPNGYSAPSVGGAEGNSDLRGTGTGILGVSSTGYCCWTPVYDCQCLKCLTDRMRVLGDSISKQKGSR